MGSGTVSDLLGWTSIACWLGAQFPQVLENMRRQSCEGLALPFLFNWLLGDITNLLGCILTHQLPFQTILAAYFVTVDFTLFSQYFYYKHKASKAPLPGPHEPAPPLRYNRGRRWSSEPEHFRELSNAAANVAIAAALAASEEELHESLLRHPQQGSPTETVVPRRQLSNSVDGLNQLADEAEDEVDEDALAALADSFHSESGRKRVSWSQERYGPGPGRGGSTSRPRAHTLSPLIGMRGSLVLPTTEEGQPEEDADVGEGRGRPRERQVADSPLDGADLERQEGVLPGSGAMPRSAVMGRRSSRASRTSVGLVFLGAWALFGVGTLSGSKRGLGATRIPPDARGIVLRGGESPLPLIPLSSSSDPTVANIVSPPTERTLTSIYIPSIGQPPYHDSLVEPESPSEPSADRIIGRMFAWSCTTLYLTSRLPQIWKNFVRKSVEGLSMYLFIFAFLGNTFYVLSILTSPMLSKPRQEATAFFMESIPYLLGSAGTLMFDVTIVFQSFLYRPNPKLGRRRPSNATHGTGQARSRAGSLAQGTKRGGFGSGTYPYPPSVRGRSVSGARLPYSRSRSTSVLAAEEEALLDHDVNAVLHAGGRGAEVGYEAEGAHNRRRREANESEVGVELPP